MKKVILILITALLAISAHSQIDNMAQKNQPKKSQRHLHRYRILMAEATRSVDKNAVIATVIESDIDLTLNCKTSA